MRKRQGGADFVPGGALIFQRMYTRLDCAGRPPQFLVTFYPYANLALSIRLRGEEAHVWISDLLQDAPLDVLESAAAILLARLYRRKLPTRMLETYRSYSNACATRRKLLDVRKKRAWRRLADPVGRHHNLAPIFDELNHLYFSGDLPKPRIGWSVKRWRSQLGIFDPGTNQIAINCALDRPDVPRFVVAYVVYHEMLHQKHPMRVAKCRLESHSREFRREEKHFREYDRAIKFLKRF